ncbi:MAG: Tetratricopeptide repeat [Armatimonadetes bacterium]|nr:Tetratricopeptide repeat [Armatimonadota bacterium]
MQTELGPRDRGLTALRQGDTTGAVALLTEALRLDPADADACSALGVAFCQTQRPQDGVRALRRAVELRPDRAPLTFNLARGLEMTGQPAAALESYLPQPHRPRSRTSCSRPRRHP